MFQTRPDLLDTLRDELNTKSENKYAQIEQCYQKLSNITGLTATEQGAINQFLTVDQKNFTDQLRTAYDDATQEPIATMETQSTIERKITFKKLKEVQEEEIQLLETNYQSAISFINTNIAADPTRKTNALNILKKEYEDLKNNKIKQLQAEENKIMADLVYLSYYEETFKDQYKQIYGKDAPLLDTREDMASLFKKSIVIKGSKHTPWWSYGTLEIQDGSVSFDIRDTNQQDEALQIALNQYRAARLGSPDKPAEITLNLPNAADETAINREVHIEQMMLKAADMGIKLEVKVAGKSYSSSNKENFKTLNTQLDEKLNRWKDTETQKIAALETIRDARVGGTEKLSKPK